MTSFTLTGGNAQNIGITLQTVQEYTDNVDDGTLDADVLADTGDSGDVRGPISAHDRRIAAISGNTLTLTVQPNDFHARRRHRDQPRHAELPEQAFSIVGNLTQQDVASHNTSHRSWWQAYWQQSFVEIPDKSIEKSWYGSLYLLGCVSRTG